MFDIASTATQERSIGDPKTMARRFIANSGARLVLVATRHGNDAGAALAYAFKDMVLDKSVHPVHWPLEEIISLLNEPVGGRDAHLESMIQQLERLRQRIELEHWDCDE